ncbi:MAG: hypothetical protein KME30_32775 [Iphinoe sp. HA4291-MV1]|jgi:chromosome segregation ATPase|nr:hypothetical protein [Iphinoe sp. HA4291-MV1]
MTQDFSNRLDRLETALARFAEIQLQTNVRQDQLMTQIQEQTRENSVALAQLTGGIANLTAQVNQLGSRVDALTTSTTETLRLVADNSIEIRRIWEYLLRQGGNGSNPPSLTD